VRWGEIEDNWKLASAPRWGHGREAAAPTRHLRSSKTTGWTSSIADYCPRIRANINGATMVASDSTMYLGVSTDSLPQVIFSFGTAPE